MKSFQQFYEQAAAAAAPAPTPSAPVQKVQRVQKSPKVSDPSSGVDKDKYDRWRGNVLNLGKVTRPGRTTVTPGKKGPDPNLPAGLARPKFDEDEYLNSLPPGVRNDMLKGGKTRDQVTDTIGLVSAGAGGAALGATGVVSGLGGAAMTQVGRLGNLVKGALPLVKGALPRLPKGVPAKPAQPARYGGYNATGKPNIPLKGEPGYKPPTPKTPRPRPGFDNEGNYIGQNYSRGPGMADRW
jgi:hypothetical protein